MSDRAVRRILWLVFLLTLPVPYFMVEVGWVPVVRLLLLSAVTGAAAALEPSATAIVIAAFFAVQTLALGAVLFGIARLIAWLLTRLVPRRRRAAALGVLVAALLVASVFEIYRTPLSGRAPRANLFRVFD